MQLADMLAMIQAGGSCVLASSHEDQPHCSLMAYVPAQEGRVIHMATSAQSRKFDNIQANPRVSLLIQSGEAQDGGPSRALTVEGVCQPLEPGPAQEEIKAHLGEQHPFLQGILADPGCRVLEVRVTSLLLLNGPQEAHYQSLDQ